MDIAFFILGFYGLIFIVSIIWFIVVLVKRLRERKLEKEKYKEYDKY